MRTLLPTLFGLPLLVLAAPAAWGHYNMLLPDKHSVKKGETVTFTYQFGHPFEHELFDAPEPIFLSVRMPDGKGVDLLKSIEKTTLPGAGGKKVAAYRFRFTPEQRGDYIFLLRTPAIWMEEDKEFVEDTVTVWLHVQAQRSREGVGYLNAITPLTQPYGLRPGMVFQAELGGLKRSQEAPQPPPVEIERYNPTPPKELPPEEYITRMVRADPNGVFTFTLTEPGWWGMTGQWQSDKKEHKGETYPVRRRATFWVFVDKAPPPKK
jgi:cobalt/nickel transport protein